MGLIGSIFRLFGLGFIGDAADSIGADKVIKDKAVDYAKDKATDYAKDKAFGYVDKKMAGSKKKKYKEPDKTDKYWRIHFCCNFLHTLWHCRSFVFLIS